MKILLLGLTKIKYMPYARFYLEQLCVPGNEVHLAFWNRDLQPEQKPAQQVILHEFSRSQNDEEHPVKKIGSFREYRRFACRLLDSGNFDLVVILHSLTGAVVFDRLKKYAGRYILDYRDVTYESFLPYRRLIASMVNLSALTLVSSDAFRTLLPQSDKILTSHNISPEEYTARPVRMETVHTPVRIGFWGYIRNPKVNLKIMEHLGNDPRFELHYYGSKQKTAMQLKTYCIYNKLKNVFFHGEYSPEERSGFASKTDIVHNMYDNDAVMSRAVSNKYYDALIFRLPQLCTHGSYMGRLVDEKGIGISVDPEDSLFADRVFAYYNCLNAERFDAACDKELDRVLGEYHACTEAIHALCISLNASLSEDK